MLTILLALALAQSPDPAQVVQSLGPQSGEFAWTWLRSPDPRTQAWGAYLALRDRRIELVPELIAQLEAYIPGAPDQRDAMMAVLDALIQLHAAVPAHDVAKMFSDFPVQSLLLVPRASPQNEILPFLLTLFQSEEHNAGVWQSAGNFLVSSHAPGFGATVLKSMTVRATIIVVGPEGQKFKRGGLFADCIGPERRKVKTGWPEIGWYDFSEHSTSDGPLAPGIDPVYFRRTVDATYAPARTCLFFPDAALVREHYLAAVLNRPIQDPPIKHELTTSIHWSNDDQYRRDLAGFVAGQQKIFADVAAKLGTSERPTLIVEAWDQRSEKTPLPEIEAGPGVSFFTTTR
jgi:hypothetical protein